MRAELADGRTLEFPDGTDPAVVQSTVKRLMAGDFGKQAAPSQRDVRKVDNEIAARKPAPIRWGDAGAQLSAADAQGAFNKMLEHIAYKGGEVASDQAAKVLPANIAAGVGVGANMATQAIPMMLGGGGAAKPLESGFDRVARWLMTSALKPDKAARATGKGAQAVETMLEKGANVSEGGVAKLRARIDEINSEIKSKIKGNPSRVDVDEVTKALDQMTDKFKKQVTPQSDLASIERALKDFENHPMIPAAPVTLKGGVPRMGKREIPVELAQELKQGTYKALGQKSYGELKGADTEAQKALARGLKEEIAKKVPGIANLNAEESKLLNAELIAQARVLADMNRNPIGLGWIASHPGETVAFILDRSPLAKSLIARALYREDTSKNLGRLLGGGLGASTGRAPVDRVISQTQERP